MVALRVAGHDVMAVADVQRRRCSLACVAYMLWCALGTTPGKSMTSLYTWTL